MLSVFAHEDTRPQAEWALRHRAIEGFVAELEAEQQAKEEEEGDAQN